MSPDLRECILRRINERSLQAQTIQLALPTEMAEEDNVVELESGAYRIVAVGAAPADDDWSDHIHLKIGA